MKLKMWAQKKEMRTEMLIDNIRSLVWNRSEESGELTTVVRVLKRIRGYIEDPTAEMTAAKVKAEVQRERGRGTERN